MKTNHHTLTRADCPPTAIVGGKGKATNLAGFTLVEIMIVVAIIGLLAAIAIPNFVKARTVSQANACINNLRQIDAAIQQWALENNAGPTATVDWTALTPYMGRGSVGSVANVFCPSDSGKNHSSSYNISDVATKPSCKINSNGHVVN